jgi:hypothetical protein
MKRQLWYLIESIEWKGIWPRPFWRLILKHMDRHFGFEFDYDQPSRPPRLLK